MQIQEGTKVRSAAYGAGIVMELSESMITVRFESITKKFLFPSCFAGFLTAEDEALQGKILAQIASDKAVQARQKRRERQLAMLYIEQHKADVQKETERKSMGRRGE